MNVSGDELRQIIAAAVAAAIDQARATTPTVQVRPGRVVATDAGSGTTWVLMDGDPTTVTTPAQTLTAFPAIGSRVQVLFVPPSGVLVLGVIL